MGTIYTIQYKKKEDSIRLKTTYRRKADGGTRTIYQRKEADRFIIISKRKDDRKKDDDDILYCRRGRQI